MAEVDRSFEVSQHVEMGKAPSEETRDAIRGLNEAVMASR
jgi:hypothetical protein